MEIFIIIILAMILFGAFYYPAEFGGYVLRLSSTIESSLYGFTPQQRRIGQFNYFYLTNSRYKKNGRGKDKVTKPTLILLHGFSADHNVWLRCGNILGKHYHVVLLDLPGHGQTTYQADADYSIPAQSQRLHQFITALELQQVHLAGNSMGGFLAAQFALDFPENTASIICVDPAGVTPPQPSTLQTLAMNGRNPFFMDSPDQFDEFFKLTMAKPPYFPKSVKLFKANEYVKRKSELVHIYRDFFNMEHVLDNKLTNIECPILMLWGGLDDIIHISCAKVWQDNTKAVSIIWDDLGHMPMLEAPKQTADEIIRFIGQH
ncbi:MAG: alpha/beta fold hydrolase [Glaciecola sp.]|jgi:abhydrolase domain-containing protein 6|uniref:alpha/beta fold hydrolase n=1 Tax=Glaciecola sp. HTCC2999 TaxID=455436 RepID=UPI0000E0FEE4|nr:alpha/beta hydrolase [Glaciecola sp. HTCC2999]